MDKQTISYYHWNCRFGYRSGILGYTNCRFGKRAIEFLLKFRKTVDLGTLLVIFMIIFWKLSIWLCTPLPRVTDQKLVVISLLALKWQFFKVEALVFSSISLNKKRKKPMLQIWRLVILRLVKISLPILAHEPLTII